MDLVPTETPVPSAPTVAEPAPLRLGYLLKLAQLRFGERARTALEPVGIDTRDWAVLVSLDELEPMSQSALGERSGIDRTTLVAVLDRLEARGAVQRTPDPRDRRRNAVRITDPGRDLRDRAAREVDACERAFLDPLGPAAAARLKQDLQTVIAPGPGPLTSRDG